MTCVAVPRSLATWASASSFPRLRLQSVSFQQRPSKLRSTPKSRLPRPLSRLGGTEADSFPHRGHRRQCVGVPSSCRGLPGPRPREAGFSCNALDLACPHTSSGGPGDWVRPLPVLNRLGSEFRKRRPRREVLTGTRYSEWGASGRGSPAPDSFLQKPRQSPPPFYSSFL